VIARFDVLVVVYCNILRRLTSVGLISLAPTPPKRFEMNTRIGWGGHLILPKTTYLELASLRGGRQAENRAYIGVLQESPSQTCPRSGA